MLTMRCTRLLLAAGAAFAAAQTVLPPIKGLHCVTAATSSQADGFIDMMRDNGYPMRGIVRDAASPGAQSLAANGVDVVQCRMDDEDCLTEALKGCRGLFVVTFAMTPEAELAQARAIASAAAASGVGKVVVSAGDALGDGGRHHDLGGESSGHGHHAHGTDDDSSLQHDHHAASGSDAQWRPLGIKHRVEQVFRGTPGLRCAFIHPAFFFESLVSKQGHARVTKTGAGERTTIHFELPLAPNVAIPMVASADVGRVAAALLADAAAHGAAFGEGPLGAVIPLAGDAVSPRQCAVAYTAAAGVSSEYTTVPDDWLEAQAEAAVAAAATEEEAAAASARLPLARLVTTMYRWYAAGHPGHTRDVVEIRKAFPHLEDVHQWMESTGVRLVHAATA